jgi:thiol-disulfide isomerase/thioredoxin
MSKSPWAIAAAALSAAAIVGCGSGAPANQSSSQVSTSGGAPLSDAPAAPAIDLHAIDRPAFDAAVAERRGNVVLVDFWATWCLPCLAQLPHTAELAASRADDGLSVMTVSLDEPADAQRAGKTLAARFGAAPGGHYISAAGGGPQAIDDFEIEGGSAPHYKLYDRAGKLRQTFGVDPSAERQFTAGDIDAAVAALLEEK